MRRVTFPITIVIGATLLLLLLLGTPAQAQTGARITFGMNPTIFRAGQPASAELSVSSVSITPLTLYSGSSFTFFVDGSLGTVTSVTTPIAVESSTLLAGDFSVSFAGGPNPVIVTYNGAPKTFAFGECLSVKIGLIASAQAGPGKLSLASQFVSAVNGNLPFTTVSIVDFANSGTSAVTHDQTLMGDGTTAMPLGLAPGAVTTGDLATGAVTATKIASGSVVRTLNGLTDNVTLGGAGGTTITASGNTLSIASSVTHDATLTGNGTGASPLGLAAPAKALLFVTEDGKLLRCYNGITGSSLQGGTTTQGCGFTVSRVDVGAIFIDLGGSITPLFWVITPSIDTTSHKVGAMSGANPPPGLILVDIYAADTGTFTDAPFMIIVY